MDLPNLSFMMNLGVIRHVQCRHEQGPLHNPDHAVGKLLSPRQRLEARLRGTVLRGRMRKNDFYRYVPARTAHYDEVFTRAVGERGVRAVFNLGCGSDTRAYRFADLLHSRGVAVYECDQPEAIAAKERLARRRFETSHVSYVPVDLNDARWPAVEAVLASFSTAPVLVMLEGVSPYVEAGRFVGFLERVRDLTSPGSALAYDYKLRGAARGFGRSGRTTQPFRLGSDGEEVRAFHRNLGFELESMTTSAELCEQRGTADGRPFAEDVLLELTRS